MYIHIKRIFSHAGMAGVTRARVVTIATRMTKTLTTWRAYSTSCEDRRQTLLFVCAVEYRALLTAYRVSMTSLSIVYAGTQRGGSTHILCKYIALFPGCIWFFS